MGHYLELARGLVPTEEGYEQTKKGSGGLVRRNERNEERVYRQDFLRLFVRSIEAAANSDPVDRVVGPWSAGDAMISAAFAVLAEAYETLDPRPALVDGAWREREAAVSVALATRNPETLRAALVAYAEHALSAWGMTSER